ncbi:MAG TPA: Flp pilus assembly protein CpaB [Gaiellaceae bacterium]
MESILSSKLFTTRRGTIILGVGAAVLAAIALIVYLNHYRNSVNGAAQPVQVLVAKSLIQKGTPGDVIGSTGLFQVTSIPKNQLKTGAFVDPKTLTGKFATANVYPGEQLTSGDFSTTIGNSLTQQLARDQRAVVVSLDSASELGGQLAAGDHVDVWVALNAQGAGGITRPVTRLVLQNMLVLNVPSGSGGNVTLKANSKQAGTLIYASQNATIWLVLRPAVGTTTTKAPVISSSELLGGAPIQVGR